jgi:HlyD family secretion protein
MATRNTLFPILIRGVSLALLLTGCGGVGGSGATPTPAAELDVSPVVSATGVVVPERESALSFATGGNIAEILVAEGDMVEEGQALAHLNTAVLDANVARAEAVLAVAQANLERAQSGARAEEIERAEDNLSAATASVAEAAAQRDQIASGATEAEIAQAEADLQAAYMAQRTAQNDHDQAIGWAFNADPDFQELFPISEEEIDQEQVADTQSALNIANQNLSSAQAYLDQLLAGGDPDDLRVADAQVWVAAAEREAAQAQLDLLLAGPRPEEIAVTGARAAEAQTALDAAVAARDDAILTAPFAGLISALEVRAGEWINPGQPILIIGAGNLRVETTDLNEIDVARVRVGAPVTVTFDALPDETVTGTVTLIAPKSSEGAGVNYAVTIDLVRIPGALRWGMTAFVDIAVE